MHTYNQLFRLDKRNFKQNLLKFINFQQNIENIKLISTEEINELSENIITLFDDLMDIPYKYGRSNVEKSRLGVWEDAKFVIKIGLPNLVKSLKENPNNLDKILSPELITEIKNEFPKIAASSLYFFYQEEIIDKNGNIIPYISSLDKKKNELFVVINKIKAIKYTDEEKLELKQKIAKISEIIHILEKEVNYLRESIQASPNSKLKLIPVSQEELLKIEKEVLSIDKEIISIEEEIKSIKIQINNIHNQVDKTSKNRDINKINKSISPKKNIISEIKYSIEYNKFMLKISGSTLELRNQLIKEKQIENNQFSELLIIANSESVEQIEKKIKDINNKIDLLENNFDLNNQKILELESEKSKFENDFIEKKSIDLTAFNEWLIEYNRLRMEGNKLSKDKDKNAEKLGKNNEKLNKYKELLKDLLSNINYKENLSKISTLKEEQKKIKNDIELNNKENKSNLEKLKKANQNLMDFKKLDQFEAKYKKLTQKIKLFSDHKEIDINEVKTPELHAFQIKYEVENIKKLLNGFCRGIEIADTNITIIESIVDFVVWQKESCSSDMKKKIEKIIPESYLKSFRGFRNRAMHSLDDIVRIEHATHTSTLLKLINAKNLLSDILKHLLSNENILFLTNQSTKYSFFEQSEKKNSLIKECENCLLPLPGKQLEDGSDRKFSHEEQIAILKSSIANSKAIINIIVDEINKDKNLIKKDNTNQTYNIANIINIMGEKDEDLSDDDLRIKQKYDALLQSLGQSLGNLQQYTILTEFAKLPIKINHQFELLHEVVPIFKDYRTSRTHYGYYHIPTLRAALSHISQKSPSLLSQLNLLYNIVQDEYKKISTVNFESIYTKSENLTSIRQLQSPRCGIQ